RTKAGNRRGEHLLREAELWAATAAVYTGFDYPYADLDRLWKTVLLNQFHDILPGSSITWVHREAEATHARVHAALEGIIAAAAGARAGCALAGSALAGSALAGSALAGSALAGSALAGSALAGSALAGSALAGSALAGVPAGGVWAFNAGPFAR